MRRILTFPCAGETLFATLDDARGECGLLIVSGGNEIRMGAHRGMAQLAQDIAAQGYPTFRYDRRGIGDSTGENAEFMDSGPDIAAAITAFRTACPHIKRVIAFGNCDAASAILMHTPPDADHIVLSNIWVIERTDDLPPPAAIKAHYLGRIKDPHVWVGIFTGAISLPKLAAGLLRLARPAALSSLPDQVANGMARFPGPISIIAAERDATAIAFLDQWKRPVFDAARMRSNITLTRLDSDSHSFANAADYAALTQTILKALSGD